MCTHRNTIVCQWIKGKAKSFKCPMNPKLLRIPQFKILNSKVEPGLQEEWSSSITPVTSLPWKELFALPMYISLYHFIVLILIKNQLWYDSQQEAKEKYRGVFEIQRSGNKTSSGEIGLDIRTHASPKVGQDQVSGGVSMPHPLHMFNGNLAQLGKKSNSVIRSRSVMVKNWCNVM